jgi:hypothetical protein
MRTEMSPLAPGGEPIHQFLISGLVMEELMRKVMGRTRMNEITTVARIR